MRQDEPVAKALGRIAELLVEREAKVSLNEVLEVLEKLASETYDAGYDDALRALDDRAREAAEREHRLRFPDSEPGE